MEPQADSNPAVAHRSARILGQDVSITTTVYRAGRFSLQNSSIATTHLGSDACRWPIPFVNVHLATVAAVLALRSFPEAARSSVVVILVDNRLPPRPMRTLSLGLRCDTERKASTSSGWAGATRNRPPFPLRTVTNGWAPART